MEEAVVASVAEEAVAASVVGVADVVEALPAADVVDLEVGEELPEAAVVEVVAVEAAGADLKLLSLSLIATKESSLPVERKML